MKRSSRIAVGIVASLTLGLGTAVYAHQGEMGAGGHAKGAMQHSMKGGMQHGAQGAKGHEAEGHGAEMHARMQARMQEKGAAGSHHRGPRTGAGSSSEQHVH